MKTFQPIISSRFQNRPLSRMLPGWLKKIIYLFHPSKPDAPVTVKDHAGKSYMNSYIQEKLTGSAGFPVPPAVLASQLHEVKKALRKLNNEVHISQRRKRRMAEKLRRQVVGWLQKDNNIYGSGFNNNKV